MALCLGLALGAGYAVADTSTGKPPGKTGGKAESAKGKPGDACRQDTDCDQAGRPLRCRDSKCQFAPVHPVT